LATEAAGLLIDFGSETLGLEKVLASCDASHTASERVMQKCGMTLAVTTPRGSRPGTRLHYRLDFENRDRPCL
ncbi:MAG: GNAT family N-acetyltransferase, partial [Myxococcales bacterium]|nr:GNAT family N-acetyltransferase [Myxococcales bacterium]